VTNVLLRYAGRRQKKESEFFSNNATSPMFEEFVAFLGDKIELDGWEGFRGGLDVRSGSTGRYALYSLYNPGEKNRCLFPVKK
jgi:RAP1 GTPase activating protein 1